MGDHRDYKKRIKSYDAQIKYVDSVFEAEICKPVEQRDEILLNECLDTLDYLHNSRRKLIAKLEADSSTCVRMAYKRPRLAFAAIIVLLILLGTGMAQAFGLRIWSALIHWDAGYLHVNYVPTEQEPFDPSNVHAQASEGNMYDGIIESTNYSSIEDALSDMGVAPMLPTYLPEDIKIDRIYGYYGESSKTLNIIYKNEQHLLLFEVNEQLESESTVTIVLPGNKDTYKTYKSNDTTYMLSQTDTMVCVTWTSGNMIYTINTDLPYEEVLLIIDSLEIYAK